MRSMPSVGLPGDAKFTIAIAIGLLLIVLDRWASRVRGSRRDLWVALRIGDVLLTEILGAFLLGYGLGGLIAQPDAVAASGPPGRFGPVGRFGGLTPTLPVSLGLVGAAVAVLTRLALSRLSLRGSTPRDGLRVYVA